MSSQDVQELDKRWESLREILPNEVSQFFFKLANAGHAK